MDERLQALLEKIQQTAECAADTAADAAYGVGKKAGQLLSVGKLNIQIADLRSQIRLQLQEVGQMIYDTHTGAPTDSDQLLGKLQEIDEIYARISQLETEIADAEGKPAVCSVCGGSIQAGDVFCRHCGMKL